jgi:rod shape determining protein RodA
MKIKYRLTDRFDYLLFAAVFLLIGIGLTAIYSASNNMNNNTFDKQLIFAFVSLFVFFLIYFTNSKLIKILSIPTYLLSLLLLFAVLVSGHTVYGAKSWLNLGPVGFQPSELGKVGMIMMLAYWLSKKNVHLDNLKDLGIALAIGLFPVILILGQPDMGTAIVYVFVILALLFWAGIDLFGLFVILSPTVIVFLSFFGTLAVVIGLAAVLVLLFYFKKDIFLSLTIFIINLASIFLFDIGVKLLRPHQQRRILTFLNPMSDPYGSGYNAIQAKTAVGSGGLLGKGFLHGSQTQLSFIPEQWTDFIFSVIGEEFGFIGTIVVVILFSVVFYRLLRMALMQKDFFESLITVGILTTLFVHFFINIGMNIGLAPVIGIPLPFLSYGGTALLVNVSMIAIVISFYKDNKEHT